MSDLPNIIVSQNHYPPTPSFWERYKKIIMLLAGLLILGEVVWAAFALTRPPQDQVFPAITSSPPSASGATLAVTGPSSVKAGDTFTVTLSLYSPKTVDGADLIVRYDPKKLSIITGDAKNAVTTSSVFALYPQNTADTISGKVNLTGLISPGSQGVSGNKDIGTITFKALSSGSTDLTLDFQPSSDKDSNVVDSKTGRDILEKVNNLKVNIQ